MGCEFIIDSFGKMNYVKFHVFGRPSGPEIHFHSDGITIKSYYDFGYKRGDERIPQKVKMRKRMGLNEAIGYYKEKNGVEYHYDEKGTLIKRILYKNDVAIKEYVP